MESFEESKMKNKKNIYLSGRTTGTISKLIESFCNKMDVERLPEFEPYSHSAIRKANKILFNRNEIPFYNIADSDLLITLGADIVGTFVSPVSYGKQYSKAIKKPDFKWIHFEPHITISGLSSDEHINLKAFSEPYVLIYLLKGNNTL